MKTGQSKGWAVQASTGELVSGKNPHAKGSAEAEAYVESWRTACLDKAVQVRCGWVHGPGAAGSDVGLAVCRCGWQQVLNGEALTKVVEALCRGRQAALKLPEAKPAYRPLVLNPFFTWLRVKGHKDTTIEHADYFYWLVRGEGSGSASGPVLGSQVRCAGADFGVCSGRRTCSSAWATRPCTTWRARRRSPWTRPTSSASSARAPVRTSSRS